MNQTVHIEGMKCDGCAMTVKQKFEQVSGVKSVVVNLEAKTATIESEQAISVSALQKTLEGTKFSIQ